MFFELIIGFHKLIKNISNRKERKNKVAKMWNRHYGKGGVWGWRQRERAGGGSKCHTQECGSSFSL